MFSPLLSVITETVKSKGKDGLKNFDEKIDIEREREREKPWRGRCACRETSQRNNHDLRNCGHASTPSSLRSQAQHRANEILDSFLYDLG